MKKAMQITTAVLFCLFIGGFGLLHLILPDRTFSPTENRNLTTLPTFSWDASTSPISFRFVMIGWV